MGRCVWMGGYGPVDLALPVRYPIHQPTSRDFRFGGRAGVAVDC